MILIYNLMGLLVGGAGILLGLMVGGATGKVSVMTLVCAIVWCYFGRERVDPKTEVKTAPKLFFIPLFYWSFPLLFLTLVIGAVELTGKDQIGSPAQSGAWQTDQHVLTSQVEGGDTETAAVLRSALQAILVTEAKAESFHVFVNRRPTAVLVLIEASNLSKFKNSAREELAELVSELTSQLPHTKGCELYLGVKGKVFYGLVQTPKEGLKTGKVVPHEPLLAFYNTPLTATTSPSTQPETQPAVISE